MNSKSFTEESLEYKQNAQWYRTKPGTMAIALNKTLQSAGMNRGQVLDAGAGFGVDSCYFARKGFGVKAVEINRGAIPFILENIVKYHVENVVDVVNLPIQEAMQNFDKSSLIAVLDGGMSHSLNEDDKRRYALNLLRVLKQGGFFALTHFSEFEEENPSMGMTRESLRELFPESNFEIVRNWRENRWTSSKSGKLHSTWNVIFRKK